MASSRALTTILPLIAPDPYQAHQKARTFIARYVHAKKWDAAVDVCFQSARELLKGGHQGSGTDLATYLVDVYDEAGVKVTNESRGENMGFDMLTRLDCDSCG
jgi:golgi to ER traffic protein 4